MRGKKRPHGKRGLGAATPPGGDPAAEPLGSSGDTWQAGFLTKQRDALVSPW